MNKNNNSVSWMRVGGVYTHATYRLVISLLLAAGYLLGTSREAFAQSEAVGIGVSAVTVAYALASYLYVRRGTWQQDTLLKITLVLDVLFLSYMVSIYGSYGAALFPLYLLLVFAYGLPNGETFLQVSAGLSTLGFTITYLLTPGWGDPGLAVGLLASLFYLPLMLSSSLPALHGERSVAIEQGAGSEPPATEAEALTELSHELKSQIKEVVTDSDKLLQQGLSPRKKTLTRAIANNSATALKLVREVDEYARLSSGQHEYEQQETTLLTIVRDVTEACGEEVESKSLTYEVVFHPELLLPVKLCGKEVRQVLSHLIGNAVKYTDRGYVRLKVSERRESGKTLWRYEISDSGKGIEEAQYDMVFEPFVRADAGRSHSNRGLGLGATIARLLVLGMGGKIGFTSEAHQGSTFWFEVPVTPIGALDNSREQPLHAATLSLNTREKQTLSTLEEAGEVSTTDVSLDHMSLLDFSSLDGFIVGEYVSEQELFGLTDQLPEEELPIPVVRYQRLQPDDMIVYSRRKFGDLLSVPASLGEQALINILRDLSRAVPDTANERPRPPKDKLSVLIAEGTSASRDILATMLVNKGHQIYLARNSQQAQDIIKSIALDLVLLDPELADKELCQSMNARPPQSCLLVCGSSTSKASIQQLADYSDGELHKPLQTHRVYGEMDRLFGAGESGGKRGIKPRARSGRRNLLNLDQQTLNTVALEELEEVDNGNGLLQRFIDRYIEDSNRLYRRLKQAFEMHDLAEVKTLAEEFESLSSQLGLEVLEEYCKRVRTIEGKDLVEKSEGLISRLEVLHKQSHLALREYRENFERR